MYYTHTDRKEDRQRYTRVSSYKYRQACDLHRLPTGFSFGILVIPSNIPPNFGIPFVCGVLVVGGGGLDGAPEFDVLLLLSVGLPLVFATRPAPATLLLSTVVVFFSFAPF